MKYISLFIGIAMLFSMVSCGASSQKIYAESDLPHNEIAIINEGTHIQVVGIDDTVIQQKYPGIDLFTFKILPGPHTIFTKFDRIGGIEVGQSEFYTTYNPAVFPKGQKMIRHHFAAGKTYLIKAEIVESGKDWQPVVIEQ